jgi:hypothetical protein
MWSEPEADHVPTFSVKDKDASVSPLLRVPSWRAQRQITDNKYRYISSIHKGIHKGRLDMKHVSNIRYDYSNQWSFLTYLKLWVKR